MNSSQLKRWKERETVRAKELSEGVAGGSPEFSLKDFYPEFELGGPYTTSLEPYCPIWALVPFFRKVIVGINPYLKDEAAFLDWYGVSPRQLLWLQESGRVEIKVTFPRSTNTIPSYLNSFFTGRFPSTIRDHEYTHRLLGEEKAAELKERFKRIVFDTSLSMDTFAESKGRAYRSTETLYLQLHALNYEDKAAEFESLVGKDINLAVEWFNLCRLFLAGPVHYSLGGVHCVADSVVAAAPRAANNSYVFPSELGMILVEAFKLYRPRHEIRGFTLKDYAGLDVYEDSELARKVLVDLNSMVITGELSLDTVEDVKNLIRKARREDEHWLRVFRVMAATAFAALMAPFNPLVGLLTGLGYSVASELDSKPIDNVLSPLTRKVRNRPSKPNLTLLFKLDDDIKKNYRDEG